MTRRSPVPAPAPSWRVARLEEPFPRQRRDRDPASEKPEKAARRRKSEEDIRRGHREVEQPLGEGVVDRTGEQDRDGRRDGREDESFREIRGFGEEKAPSHGADQMDRIEPSLNRKTRRRPHEEENADQDDEPEHRSDLMH